VKASVALLVVFLLVTLVAAEVVLDAIREPSVANVLAASFGVVSVGLLVACLRDVGRGGRRG
jgi:hypothetical protein